MGNLIDLKQAAVAVSKATQAYNQAFWAFEQGIPPLADRDFWAAIRRLYTLFADAIRYGRSEAGEWAADEFVRSAVVNARDAQAEEEVLVGRLRFAATYRAKAGRLYEPLFDVIGGRGDDGYGDLLDALPLAGREVFEAALAEGFSDESDVRQMYREHAFYEAPHLKGVEKAELMAKVERAIFEGENYLRTKLSDAVQRFLRSHATVEAGRLERAGEEAAEPIDYERLVV